MPPPLPSFSRVKPHTSRPAHPPLRLHARRHCFHLSQEGNLPGDPQPVREGLLLPTPCPPMSPPPTSPNELGPFSPPSPPPFPSDTPYLVPHALLLPAQRQCVLRVFILQVVHEGVPLALHLRLLEAGEGLEALGGDDGVPALRGVHQPYVGEAPRAVAQSAVLPRVLGIVGRDHVGAGPVGICTGRESRAG